MQRIGFLGLFSIRKQSSIARNPRSCQAGFGEQTKMIVIPRFVKWSVIVTGTEIGFAFLTWELASLVLGVDLLKVFATPASMNIFVVGMMGGAMAAIALIMANGKATRRWY